MARRKRRSRDPIFQAFPSFRDSQLTSKFTYQQAFDRFAFQLAPFMETVLRARFDYPKFSVESLSKAIEVEEDLRLDPDDIREILVSAYDILARWCYAAEDREKRETMMRRA